MLQMASNTIVLGEKKQLFRPKRYHPRKRDAVPITDFAVFLIGSMNHLLMMAMVEAIWVLKYFVSIVM